MLYEVITLILAMPLEDNRRTISEHFGEAPWFRVITSYSIHYTKLYEDLAAVASFHGSLQAVKPAEPGMVKTKIRVYTGGADKLIPPQAVADFEQEMTRAGADYKVRVYPGALHSFTNPDSTRVGKEFNLPMAYNEKADRESWQDLQKFFAAVFKK